MINKLLTTLLFLLSALTTWAQIAVTEFKLDKEDITALHTAPVLDQNGYKCALIRVQTTQDGFIFDTGRNLPPEKIDYSPVGEVWVYVPYGVRQIMIAHPQLGRMDEWYTFPVPIEKACTYVMKLVAGEVQTVVKKAVREQHVLFRLKPQNAVVEFDNKLLTVTDGVATAFKSFGTYSYTVKAPLYYDAMGVVEVNDPENKHIVEVSLKPAFATVTLVADESAEIWVNGEKKAVGKWTGALGYETCHVETKKASHHAASQNIEITPESEGKSITLESPIPIYGSVNINSIPADADIYINNKKIGTTPMMVRECLIGQNTIRISKQGYKDSNTTIEIKEGETEEINLTLEKGETINVSSNAATAIRGSKTFIVNGVSFTMIPVEGGTFMMGATNDQNKPDGDEIPVHQVTLSNYMIGETEVTQALWEAVMGSNPSYFKGENKPVECISWKDCQKFIANLNKVTHQHFRFPTEAEWEYAARGGNKKKGYQYSGSNNIGDVAWYTSNSNTSTHPVKAKQPNELGIYDMSGNVWEWCLDWKDDYSRSAQTNPMGPSSGPVVRVVRGGCWNEGAWGCRSAFRGCYFPDSRTNNLGFRLALSE